MLSRRPLLGVLISFSILLGLWLMVARRTETSARAPALSSSLVERSPSDSVNVSADRALSRSSVPQVPLSQAPAVASSTDPYELKLDPVTGLRMYSYVIDYMQCLSKNLCPARTLCEISPDKRVGCYASNCSSVVDTRSCASDEVCWRLGEIYRCVPAGSARRNDECVDINLAPLDKRCSGGLACLGGRCRSACSSGADCGGDERCVQLDSSASGAAVCMKAKDMCSVDSDCGGDEVCAKLSGGSKQRFCVALGTHPDGQRSCRPGGCPPGQACEGPVFGRTLYARCRLPCSTGQCPVGNVCAASSVDDALGVGPVCFASCGVGASRCAGGAVCSSLDETGKVTGCTASPPFDMREVGNWDGVFQEPPASLPAKGG